MTDLEGVGEPAEDVLFSLLIADELGALQVAADVLLQSRRQVAVGHKLGHSLHLQSTQHAADTLSPDIHCSLLAFYSPLW